MERQETLLVYYGTAQWRILPTWGRFRHSLDGVFSGDEGEDAFVEPSPERVDLDLVVSCLTGEDRDIGRTAEETQVRLHPVVNLPLGHVGHGQHLGHTTLEIK